MDRHFFGNALASLGSLCITTLLFSIVFIGGISRDTHDEPHATHTHLNIKK